MIASASAQPGNPSRPPQAPLNGSGLPVEPIILGKLEPIEVDHSLVLRAQRLTTGATVHRFSQALTIYIGNAELWNQFVTRGFTDPAEVQEKMVLRDRALATHLQLRREVLAEELRSIGSSRSQC